MDKQDRLIERIHAGWYDDKVETLLENAERECNYPIWKACRSRKEVAGVGPHLRMPSRPRVALNMPKGIRCGICAPKLRPYARDVAMLLKLIGAHNMDVGYRPCHIKAAKLAGLDALVTRVGQRDHNVKFYVIEEQPGQVIYLVQTTYSNGTSVREVFTDHHRAAKHFLQEVDDECLCTDL